MGFFEKHFTVWKIHSFPTRRSSDLATVFIIIIAKLLGSLIVYYVLNVNALGTFWVGADAYDTLQNQIFQTSTFTNSKWLTVFLGWDSAWYLSILNSGYSFSMQSYSFFPGLPLFSSLFNFFTQNPAVSLISCSLTFGILWVPIYQLVAELYINKKAAFISTLIFALSPYVFLFTTVAYSEGLLLFWVLSAWLLFKKGKTTLASASAAVAVLARVVGILIIIPMIIETIKTKKPHKVHDIVLCCLPSAAFLAWLCYGQATANDWLALIHTTEWHDMYSFRELIFTIMPQTGFQALLEVPASSWFTALSVWASIIFPPFIIAEMAKNTKSMMAYSLAYFVGALVFGAMLSLPRFMSILFPLWFALMARLSINKTSVTAVALVLFVFFICGIYLWINFLNGAFIA
jgi:Gpi18-like mannosyltransferase